MAALIPFNSAFTLAPVCRMWVCALGGSGAAGKNRKFPLRYRLTRFRAPTVGAFRFSLFSDHVSQLPCEGECEAIVEEWREDVFHGVELVLVAVEIEDQRR